MYVWPVLLPHWLAVKRTFLLEADFDGDKVLKEDIVDVGVVQIEEML